MIAVPNLLIFMLVSLLEILQPSEPVTVDYVQGGLPEDVYTVSPVEQSDEDVYVMTSESGITIRLEQTDFVAHNYVIYTPDGPPFVIDMSPIRQQLRLSSRGDGLPTGDYVVTLSGQEGDSGVLHVLVRTNHVILSSETDGAILVTR